MLKKSRKQMVSSLNEMEFTAILTYTADKKTNNPERIIGITLRGTNERQNDFLEKLRLGKIKGLEYNKERRVKSVAAESGFYAFLILLD